MGEFSGMCGIHEVRNMYRIVVGLLMGRDFRETSSIGGRLILEQMLKKEWGIA